MPRTPAESGEDWLSPFEPPHSRESERFDSLELDEGASPFEQLDAGELARDEDDQEPAYLTEEEEDTEGEGCRGCRHHRRSETEADRALGVDSEDLSLEQELIDEADEEDTEGEECRGCRHHRRSEAEADRALGVDSEDLSLERELIDEADEEDTEGEECCGCRHHGRSEAEADRTLRMDSEDLSLEQELIDEASPDLANEEAFDQAEDFAWEVDWREEGAAAGRVLAAGSTIIDNVPLLHNHSGIGPDAILSWNEISGAPTAVDVVVHLHGYALSPEARLHIVRDLKSRSGLDWLDPSGGSTSPGRARPTLAILPRGHYYGGKSGRAYSFPALTAADGIQKLVDFALQHLATALGVASLSRRRLILTAHSGGVASLLKILRHLDPDEVHVFDGLYQNAARLIQWATRRAERDGRVIENGTTSLRSYMTEQGGALRVLYGAGTARFSHPVARALGSLLPRDSALRRWYRSERTTVGHLKVPPVYGWRLLADVSADLPHAAEEKDVVGRELTRDFTVEGETVISTGAVVTFASGVSLPIITGPAIGTDKDDYFDPVDSGNPLIDTSGARKDLKLSPSFTVRELTTSGGKSADIARIDPKLVDCLQRLRDHVGKPLTITSGFRSWKRNRDVYKAGNKPPTKSQHCAGRAADVRIGGMNGLQVGKAAIDAYGPNIGIGVGSTFAHIDVRGVAKAWDYGGAAAAWVAEVKQYQRQKGGVTRSARPAAPTVAKRPRPPEETVRFAQRVLNAAENERLDTDGHLGPNTRGALDRLAARHGLPARGEISEQIHVALVQRALEELAQSSQFRKGTRDAATDQAIARFKSQRALGSDATLDAATRLALADALEQQKTTFAAPSPSEPAADWSAVPLTNRMRYVVKRLVDVYGYPVNGAAGLVGNLVSESGVLPNRIEGSKSATPMIAPGVTGTNRKWTAEDVRNRVYGRTGPKKPGVGLAQWTTAHRRSGLFNHSYQGRVLGANIVFDMDAQIDYLVGELRSLYSRVDATLRDRAVTVNDACDEVLYNFEIPGSILNPPGTQPRKKPRTDPDVIAVFRKRRDHAHAAVRVYESELVEQQRIA